MAGFNTDADRNVIPRLRTFRATRAMGELDTLTQPNRRDHRADRVLRPKIVAWRTHETIGHASDLVGAALTLRHMDGDVEAAARLLVSETREVSPWARELGNAALGRSGIEADSDFVRHVEAQVEDGNLYAQVRTFRTLLHKEPRDPVTWVDLAFAYACLGHRERAAKAMTVALQLSEDNRFVLRSAGRLWVYLDDPEKAYHIVAQSKRTVYDPWLLAAKMALGSIVGKGRQHIKQARQLIAREAFDARQISELASALATLELSFGSTRKAKRLFARSLEDPTENSVAQASWAGRRDRGVRLHRTYSPQRNAFEAAAWNGYLSEQWQDVVSNSKRWFGDQPFSRRPAGLGSFVATTALQDHSTGRWFAAMGLRANPGDFTLLNNLAFACLQLGKIREAEDALQKIDRGSLSEGQLVVLRATLGLMSFRNGNLAQGRELYAAALNSAHRLEDRNIGQRIHALASMFYAFEELSVDGPNVDAVCGDALKSASKVMDPIVEPLERRLKNEWRAKK